MDLTTINNNCNYFKYFETIHMCILCKYIKPYVHVVYMWIRVYEYIYIYIYIYLI